MNAAGSMIGGIVRQSFRERPVATAFYLADFAVRTVAWAVWESVKMRLRPEPFRCANHGPILDREEYVSP